MRKYGEAIPTEYHGVKFRSRLEANIASVLDAFEIKWEYETKSFLLPSGHYMPDFYCPEIKTYVEGKGIVTEQSKQLARELAEEGYRSTVIMIGKEQMIFEGNMTRNCFGDSDGCSSVDESVDDLMVVMCHNCKRYFFIAQHTGWVCSSCGTCGCKPHIALWKIDFTDNSSVRSFVEFTRAIRESYQRKKQLADFF